MYSTMYTICMLLYLSLRQLWLVFLIFILLQVPAELYDAALQHLFLFDHEAVDAIMRRKCLELE